MRQSFRQAVQQGRQFHHGDAVLARRGPQREQPLLGLFQQPRIGIGVGGEPAQKHDRPRPTPPPPVPAPPTPPAPDWPGPPDAPAPGVAAAATPIAKPPPVPPSRAGRAGSVRRSRPRWLPLVVRFAATLAIRDQLVFLVRPRRQRAPVHPPRGAAIPRPGARLRSRLGRLPAGAPPAATRAMRSATASRRSTGTPNTSRNSA